jgi:hypothetical protein
MKKKKGTVLTMLLSKKKSQITNGRRQKINLILVAKEVSNAILVMLCTPPPLKATYEKGIVMSFDMGTKSGLRCSSAGRNGNAVKVRFDIDFLFFPIMGSSRAIKLKIYRFLPQTPSHLTRDLYNKHPLLPR